MRTYIVIRRSEDFEFGVVKTQVEACSCRLLSKERLAFFGEDGEVLWIMEDFFSVQLQ
jgi:hypothetical protein